ncbi:MAG: hypothetical protein IPM66_11390 [Acidobacteriota bacterium]|nr:MAG: hypothetical protein IPM66_11390 [Acidobacteriota bacterium]
MFRPIATIILILTIVPVAATAGQICHIESGMDCCIDESGCPMPMHETDRTLGAAADCVEMCACTLERRESPLGSPPENRPTAGHSTTTVTDCLSMSRERHFRDIRPPLIDDRRDTYLQINCFRI